MLRILTLAAFLLSNVPAIAQVDPAPPISDRSLEETRTLTDAFFNALKRGEVDKAYTDLFAGTLVAQRTIEIQNLAGQTRVGLQTYGAVESWNLVRSDCISATYCRLIFQVDTAQIPVFFTFVIHRRNESWKALSVFFTDVSTPLFD